MATILIIGSTGMLGSAVAKLLDSTNHVIVESNTTGNSLIQSNNCIKFDITKNSVEELFEQISIPIDFIINCSGVIRHKIDEVSLDSVRKAQIINTDFPKELAVVGDSKSIRIIQIATDCVYSGSTGLYDEDSVHDAVDYYGRTKSDGEIKLKNSMFLRCSIIGKEIKHHVSFMDWILEQPINSNLKGFTNHLWNGVTTLHFAKIVLGVVNSNSFEAGIHHVIAGDSASKFEMIEMISKSFGRDDINVEKFQAGTPIDRRLATKFPNFNRNLWLNAGYDTPPSIHEMITEYSNWVRAK
jgi:dTDP-4-dehydrorhamnose reductase